MSDDQKPLSSGMTRRQFLGSAAGTAALITAAGFTSPVSATAPLATAHAGGQRPWYERIHRIGQINLSEKDPESCDIPWWRRFWKHNECRA